MTKRGNLCALTLLFTGPGIRQQPAGHQPGQVLRGVSKTKRRLKAVSFREKKTFVYFAEKIATNYLIE